MQQIVFGNKDATYKKRLEKRGKYDECKVEFSTWEKTNPYGS